MKMAAVLALLVSLTPIGALLASPPSYRQQALDAAYQAGTAFAPPDWPVNAHPFPETVQAILIEESSECAHIHNPVGKGAMGCMQLYNPAVIQVVGFKINRRALEQNWTLNIRIGAAYLAYCWSMTHKAALTISCYNKGPYAYRWHDAYVATIVRIMDTVLVDTD